MMWDGTCIVQCVIGISVRFSAELSAKKILLKTKFIAVTSCMIVENALTVCRSTNLVTCSRLLSSLFQNQLRIPAIIFLF